MMTLPQKNLLDYLYHQKYYKLIAIYYSRETNTSILQQINFVGKLGKDEGATMFFIDEKQQKTIPNFSFRFINSNRII